MRDKAGETESTTVTSSELDVARICAAALLGIVSLVVFGINVLGGASESTSNPDMRSTEALTLSEYELLSRAERIEPPAYWVGRRPEADHFELEKEANGSLYVRYVGDGAATGNPHSDSLTVASYPVAEAQQRLERAARAKGQDLSRRDGFVMLGSDKSYEAYVAFEELPELQVEIYSPRRGEAVELADSGALRPLHWTPLD